MDYKDKIKFGVLSFCENHNTIDSKEVFGKDILLLDGLKDKQLAEAYWKLDGNAFNDQPAPVFMKQDALILGGLPILMFLPNEYENKGLKETIGAEHLENIPIGFMDLHRIESGKYSVSGLGISNQYQGLGLSKSLIYAGAKIAGIKELIIPTQLSNQAAHYAWLHLAPLKIISVDFFHNKTDSILYKAEISNGHEHILENKNTTENGYHKIQFSNVKKELDGKECHLVGYLPDALVVDYVG